MVTVNGGLCEASRRPAIGEAGTDGREAELCEKHTGRYSGQTAALLPGQRGRGSVQYGDLNWNFLSLEELRPSGLFNSDSVSTKRFAPTAGSIFLKIL